MIMVQLQQSSEQQSIWMDQMTISNILKDQPALSFLSALQNSIHFGYNGP